MTRVAALGGRAQPAQPGGRFEQFLARNPDLLERTLLEHFYSRERMLSRSARASWVAPDLRGLPILVEQM